MIKAVAMLKGLGWKMRLCTCNQSSNQMKLSAVQMSLGLFSEILQEKEALCIRIDNVVTEFYLRRWRTKREMFQLPRKVRKLLTQLGIRIQTQHIPGVRSQILDIMSRMEISEDQKLDQAILQIASEQLQIFTTIDGFANRTNKQQKIYCKQAIEAVNNEPYSLGESGSDSDTRSNNDTERTETISGRPSRSKDN
ncbi:MAG: hypothetical protein EZS28_009307, partial [Streblomastix strix]